MKKKSPTSKSNKASGNIAMATEQVYRVVIKSIISSLVQHCPKKILIEISSYINTIYSKLKDKCLNSFMENDTVKRREQVWKNVTSRVLNILHPLILYTNFEQKHLLELPSENHVLEPGSTQENIHPHILNHTIKAYMNVKQSGQHCSGNINWPKPLEINFL